MSDSPWLTVAKAAARARCGKRSIQRAAASRELRSVRAASRLLFLDEWVDTWLRRSDLDRLIEVSTERGR